MDVAIRITIRDDSGDTIDVIRDRENVHALHLRQILVAETQNAAAQAAAGIEAKRVPS